jgi:hypothetical protein
MTGFTRMDEKCRGACTGQRRRNLVADVSGLAHAADDDASLARQNQRHCGSKAAVQTIAQGLNGAGLNTEYAARQGQGGVMVKYRRGDIWHVGYHISGCVSDTGGVYKTPPLLR